jgi:hypothetical protein
MSDSLEIKEGPEFEQKLSSSDQVMSKEANVDPHENLVPETQELNGVEENTLEVPENGSNPQHIVAEDESSKPIMSDLEKPKVENDCEITHSEPIAISENAITFGHNETSSKMIYSDTELKPQVSTTSHINKDLKARELLKQLRSIVSNPCHDFKSKFNNINFTKSSQGALDAYSSCNFKPISTKDQLVNGLNVTELDFGFRQSHIDNANAEKTQGFSPKIFPKKQVTSAGTSKLKPFKRLASEPDMKTKSLVSRLTALEPFSILYTASLIMSPYRGSTNPTTTRILLTSQGVNNQDSSSELSSSSALKNKVKTELRTQIVDSTTKSAKFSEKNGKANPEAWDFMSNFTPNDPKEVSDNTLNTFENYLTQVQTMYFGMPETAAKNSLNELSLKLNSRTQDGPMSMDGSNTFKQVEEHGMISSNFYFSTLDML